MNKTKQRIAIAEACGWKFRMYEGGVGTIHFGWFDPTGRMRHWSNQTGDKDCPECLPEYLDDLNAMHEAEKELKKRRLFHKYWLALGEFWKGNNTNYSFHATAAQRAEAFLKTLNLWEN